MRRHKAPISICSLTQCFRPLGISDVAGFFEKGVTVQGRMELAEVLGMEVERVEKWWVEMKK